MDLRLTTFQNHHDYDFAVLTTQTSLPTGHPDTQTIPLLIRDHVDTCIKRSSSILHINLVRYCNEYVEPYIGEFITPQLNATKQQLSDTQFLIRDFNERTNINTDDTRALTTSIFMFHEIQDKTNDMAIENTEEYFVSEKKILTTQNNLSIIGDILT